MSFFSKNEALVVAIAAVMIGYLLAFKEFSWINWLSYAGIAALIVLIHHAGYKISASLLDCSAETKLWGVKQFWFSTKSHFRKPFPVWFFIPLSAVWLSLGAIKWTGIVVFDVAPLASRIRFRWRELTEWHIALIATGAAFANIIAAIVAKILGFESFAFYNLMFVFFSLIPIGQLDGTKMFFGSRLLWAFMIIFSLIMLLLIQTTSAVYTTIAAVCIAVFAWIIFYMFYEAS
jgi:hypothetical protein